MPNTTPDERQARITEAELQVLKAVRILNQWDEQEDPAVATALVGPRAEWEAAFEAARRALAEADNAAFDSGDNLYLSTEESADYMTNILGRRCSVHTIRNILREPARRAAHFPRARSTGAGRRVTHMLHIDDLRAWHPATREGRG